jgi:hypothetical protein
MKNEYEKHISQRTRIPKKKQQHESTLQRGHRLCGVEIFHTQIGRCFQLTLLLKCDYLAFVYGGMGASIALLNEHDNVSYVFTPYSFIFICIRHMIGKIGEKWQRAMT